ncbi:MAG: patatin-like phospholipase family protein [Pseudomonadales bacterium]
MSEKGPLLILSIDGGGSRGVIPANVLHLFEQEANTPVRETFDFFAGVSTGSLLAAYLALNSGSLERLAKHSYSSENMSQIFNKSIWDRLLGRVQNQPKYDGKNKRAYIESLADGARINDIKDKHLLILAYDFINRELVTFKNNRGHDAAYNPLLAEVCDSATAAPTLYPTVPTSQPVRRWLIDGALTTNDPSICAITEALALGHALEDIWLVSLGTGRPVHDLGQEARDKIGMASRDWGVFGWINNGLLEHMLSASSCISAFQCSQLLGDRYLRINGDLPRKYMQLDNTSNARVADLAGYAFAWFEANLPRFHSLIQRVTLAREEHAAGFVDDVNNRC